ncbi:MAG: MoxR family ATPase [Candidatus Caenarcaniphilales bacterium]|jgi:MoxR-like ATPase|nr:MoxR family ATPase [Candidatus Caenarcaniphilales bacterium]
MTNITSSTDLEQLTTAVQMQVQGFNKLKQEIHKKIIGQESFIERLLLGIIASGHILIEGVPGLAKTETVKALAKCIGLNFQRIQFTPDLLPADLIGTQIYKPNTSEFETKKGPLFSNLILADEINRAPAKVQSALLEAMAEKHITIGETTYNLEEPFIVLATQNPLEQEGTYALPEAQMDRFLMKLKIDYPNRQEEKQIMNLMSIKQEIKLSQIIGKDELFKARELVDKIYLDEKVQDYIIDIVFATRGKESKNANKKIKELENLIEYGASPRASIALALAAKTHAFLQGRAYVTPQDVKNIGFDVLRQRIVLSFEAEAEDKTTDDIIAVIFDSIEVP